MDRNDPGYPDRQRGPPETEDAESTRRRIEAERNFLAAREAWYIDRVRATGPSLLDAIRQALADRRQRPR